MQETRQHILQILKERGHATVEELVEGLQARKGQITAVTVRHHLGVLQEDGLISEPELRHRAGRGRPQYMYALTEKAHEQFPNNYQRLVAAMLQQMRVQLPAPGINVILEGVADSMASNAYIPDAPMPEKLDAIVVYLNTLGYSASWGQETDGYVLHTRNCPYHTLSETGESLCEMDMRMIAGLLGTVPRRISRVSEGDATCSYRVPITKAIQKAE